MHITQAAIDSAVDSAKATYPKETCGILLGNEALIREAVAVTNDADEPGGFQMNEIAAAMAEAEGRKRGLTLVGYFHSHPDNLLLPSPQDRAGTPWADAPPFWHMIVGVDGSWSLFDTEGRTWKHVGAVIEDS